MSKKIKFLALGFLALALIVGVGVSTTNAALTLEALTITSSGALTLDGAAASNIVLGSATTTGTFTLGGALTTGTITVGKSDQTGAVVVYGGTTAANTLFNNVTTGSIAVGAALTTGNLTLGGAQTSGAITIGGGVQTGTITLGGGTGAQIVNVGTGATGVKTINIGTSAVANVLTIGTETGAASLELMYGTGAFKASPTPNTTLVQDELSFHVVPIAGGAATEAETFTGLRTTAVVVCSANALTNAVTLNKSAITADTITFTFSADPGASSLSCMIHNI